MQEVSEAVPEVVRMKWKAWDGRRKVEMEEIYSKVQDLIKSNVPYDNMRDWTHREIMGEWEEKFSPALLAERERRINR